MTDRRHFYSVEQKRWTKQKQVSEKRTISFGLPSWKKVVLGLMMMSLTVVCVLENIRYQMNEC